MQLKRKLAGAAAFSVGAAVVMAGGGLGAPAAAGYRPPRAGAIATVENVGGYPAPYERTIVYSAAASETGYDGANALLAFDCTASAPTYFLMPTTTYIRTSCWLLDETTGRQYAAPAVGESITSTAAAVQLVPADHTYSICMRAYIMGQPSSWWGWGPTRCDRLGTP